ncbi:hypothetical protein BGX34_005858 [Mortierella sp. NVP85]|nr:hypothetical protein BGX34_005858 [Mortierella sp. NVP85]
MTSTRPREGRGIRHTAGGEHDRLKRAVLQPVQCWDKKWTESKNGRSLQVFKWVKSDRQVDFDDDDDDDEIEQISVPRATEEVEEVGTPAPALPTLQDADDNTTASTPVQTGEEDEEDETEGPVKSSAHPLAQSYSAGDRRPSLTSRPIITKTSSRDNNNAIQEDREGGDDDEDDTDSNRPLVFTPSLETPVETQANTPQDFESMSPAPVEMDDLKREVQVEMVVQGLDQGQAEMEEEMEDHVVKEIEHGHPTSDSSSTGVISAESLEASSSALSSLPSMTTAVLPPKDEPDLGMDIDGPPATSS